MPLAHLLPPNKALPLLVDQMKMKRNLSLRRLLHFISRAIARKQLLVAAGFLSAVLNFWLFNILYSGSKSSEYLEPEASLTVSTVG